MRVIFLTINWLHEHDGLSPAIRQEGTRCHADDKYLTHVDGK